MQLNGNITHSRRLLASIDRILADTKTDWKDIDGIGVGLGPGSFTGLRIGLATAKGLATGAGLPLIGVSTLDSLVLPLVQEGIICAMLDARKKEVYTCLYRKKAGGSGFTRLGDRMAVTPEKLCETITEPVCFVGDGALVYKELLCEQLGTLVSFAPQSLHPVNSISIGLLCGDKLRMGEILDVAEASPHYIRASDAELSLVKK